MKRVAGGLVACALLAGAIACTSDDPPDAPPTKDVAVDPDEVVRHEAAAGAPISFGIDVPEGAVQVGPLVRQRRAEVAEVIDGRPAGRADSFDNAERGDESNPQTRDPEEPTPPDFTTAMLRIDGEPSEVVEQMLAELADSLEGSDIDSEHWRKYCTVLDGVYTGCRLQTSGTTDDDETIAVEFTVDPGNPNAKSAPAGSLLRPVIVLTLERIPAPERDAESNRTDPATAQAREAQAAIDARQAEETAKAEAKAAKKKGKKGKKNRSGQTTHADDNSADDPATDEAEQSSDNNDESNDNGESNDSEDEGQQSSEPQWPTMKREWPAAPGDWILTPKWKVRPNTEVILSSSMPQVAMLAVKDGADADKIARRYIRVFADEATTPKIDEVEDRNERSTTYTPRNDGSGPSMAVTTVATGRGNYIELLFSDGDPTDGRDDRSGSSDGGKKSGGNKSGDKSKAKRTTSNKD